MEQSFLTASPMTATWPGIESSSSEFVTCVEFHQQTLSYASLTVGHGAIAQFLSLPWMDVMVSESLSVRSYSSFTFVAAVFPIMTVL